jgi:hypothetical protein
MVLLLEEEHKGDVTEEEFDQGDVNTFILSAAVMIICFGIIAAAIMLLA